MRRTAVVMMTTLLASAAALAVPAAAQAASTSTGRAPAAALAGGCNAFASGGGQAVGICTGISPSQIWHVQAQCQWYVNGTGPYMMLAQGASIVGDGQSVATCGFGRTVLWPQVVFTGTVPPPVAGPQGQITGYVGKCVDDAGAKSNNGNPIQIWDCNGSDAQKWTVGVDGTLRVLGKCMDVTGGGTANHTMVQLYDCNGSGAQQWKAQPDGSLLNPQSGRCLDDLGFATNNGNQLGIWDCNGAANQKWNLPH
ncbi:ricin-type beta-trefoil lectin domain protein [Kitasatospora sp. SUK 42]|uniref:ricin-type beta-trefoil lectin domain protein n=1 Tax=Kitasatospora sp. SUK 42 TaxID=1588882 RepID=UPI0018C8DC17|nr:ricin-type beta-trefoil lectin domain protein [Kitasatospora sp. SUK 42]MBV2155390.1 ricin-type beta-trefoil lectin domain protein [Kitasatospora sp. SUK 42]